VGKQFIASSIEKVSFGTSVIGKLGQFVKSEARKDGKMDEFIGMVQS